MSFFINYLSLTMGGVLVCYGLGALGHRLLGGAAHEPAFTLFFRLVLGLGYVAGGYAVWCTGGASILLPSLGLLLALGFVLRGQPARQAAARARADQPGWPGQPVALLLGLAGVIFTARYFLLYDPASPFLRTPFQDYVYYARLVLPLNQYGVETNVLDILDARALTVQPYHYLDLWLNALAVRLTVWPASWCLFLSIASILLTLVAVGFVAVLAHFKVRGGWAVGLALLLVGMTGVSWPGFAHYAFTANGGFLASSLLPVQPKLAPVYLFVQLGTLLLLRRQFVTAGLALAITPLVYAPTALVLGPAVLLLAAGLAVTGRLTVRSALLMTAPVLAVGLYLLVFYHGALPAAMLGSAGSQATGWFPTIPGPSTLVNIFVGVLLNFGLYFLPYAGLLLGLFYKRQYAGESLRPVLLWFGGVLLLAALVRTLSSQHLDGTQFFSNSMVPVTAVVFAALLAAALADRPRWWRPAVAVVLLALLAVNGRGLLSLTRPAHQPTRYSAAFLTQVSRLVPTLGNRGGYLLADQDYESGYTMSSDSYTAGTYIANFKNYYTLSSLSVLDIKDLGADARFARDSAQINQNRQRSAFYRFVQRQRPGLRRAALDRARYDFVVRHGLRFICASRRAVLPAGLRPLVATACTDAYSGETLYVLRAGPGPPEAAQLP